MLSIAQADSVPAEVSFHSYANPANAVMAVSVPFAKKDGNIRLSVYDNETDFLESATSKHDVTIGKDGVAVLDLKGLTPGTYAFVAYYDENEDGKLNRNVLGIPKEPYAFSNNVKAKLRKPHFDEAKVEVGAGDVVIIELEN